MRKTIENSAFRFKYDIKSRNYIGSMEIRHNSSYIPSISKIAIKRGRKHLQVISYTDAKETVDYYQITALMSDHIEFHLKMMKNSPIMYIIPKSQQTIRNYDLTLEITINFHGSNQYDYINLSGNKYRKVTDSQKFSLKVPPTRAFAQTWTIHNDDLYCGIIGLNQTEIRYFQAKFTATHIILSQKIKLNANTKFCVIAGRGELTTPLHVKFTEIVPIEPLEITYAKNLQSEAVLSFNTLYEKFLLDTKSGKVPSNFVMYKTDNEGNYNYILTRLSTIGNCFSLGYITGTMTVYKWLNESKYLEILESEFLPPLINDALVQSGVIAGSYLDTYNQKLDYWTTGRIQDPNRGFSGFFPLRQDEKGKDVVRFLPPIKEQLHNGIWHFLIENLLILSLDLKNPALFKKYDHLVVSPPYSGQIAYNLFQTLLQIPHKPSNLELTTGIDKKLKNAIESTVKFLLKYQRGDGLWEQELLENGEIFWDRKTLACIYPAVLLYWWGTEFDKKEIQEAGSKAIDGCVKLLGDGEYYGVYFETDAANHQGDLVTAIACIKCFSKLYDLTRADIWLNHARTAAWHMLSYMWGTGVQDTKNNVITGGMPVTTYKSIGYPVIGGSELCQAIEGLLELSFWDFSFLKYAEAAMGYHSHYMYFHHKNDRATREIMWGTMENWSTSRSADFASYATGPFIRSLFLYEKLRKKKKEN